MNFIEWLIFNWYNVSIEIDKLEVVWEVEYLWENSFCSRSILFLHLF